MKADSIREKFLQFFKARSHRIVESDSLVPSGDPTVLFTPAGMNQFKKEFLGHDSGFKRAASAQRCLRTDDLDKVGHTLGHHTFFEMLGNFSFGDYFKQEAITYAWEFLTDELKLDTKQLWVSVYQDDKEAYAIWKDKIKVSPERIVKLGDKDNFWPSEAKAKGPNGPCGPCSEIFIDYGSEVGCGKADCSPACCCGRFVEIWNLVFTQFNRKADGSLIPLPHKNIDTGMGLERLAAVMQGVKSNFETDLFKPLIDEVAKSSKLKAQSPKELIYAIVDHLRAVTFAIYDGALPSNEERGYVVRKVIRKSVLHLRALGITQPLLYKLVAVLSQVMEKPYPELAQRKENISSIILTEETNFIHTLNTSEALFKEKLEAYRAKQDSHAVGTIAFQLYDTHGIPLELTKEWLDKKGILFFQQAFDAAMKDQRDRSKLKSSMKGDVFADCMPNLNLKETKFLGYDSTSLSAKITALLTAGGEIKKIDASSGLVEIVVDKTVFYAQGGGQTGDSGVITKGKSRFVVQDTKRIGKFTVHIGNVAQGSFKKSDLVKLEVNLPRRLSIARNHTATHLLQAALTKVLGNHVKQEGSLVAEDRLRFDFRHFKSIDKDQLNRIEEVVNGHILDNHVLEKKVMPLAAAKKAGALAFFQEKYADKVRVVSIEGVSKELCGGTHLNSTGQVGLFKIIQEESVASGVRRIEAATGNFAYRLVKKEGAILEELSEQLNVPFEMLSCDLRKRLSMLRELEKQLSVQKIDSLKSSLDSLLQQAEQINNVKLITKVFDDMGMNLLRKNADLIKQKTTSTVMALGSSFQGKAFLVVGVTDDLVVLGFDATKLTAVAAKIIGGSGGGRKDFAQAGGTSPENFEQAFESLKKLIASMP